MASLGNLVGAIDGFKAFHHGPNIDVEHKSPEAQVLGSRLVALCGGSEQIKVYDIDTTGVFGCA